MSERTSPVPSFPWWWLLPSVLLAGVITAWGIAVYPNLPDQIPQHVGVNGVTAWWDTSVGTVFLPLFVYAGVTALFAGGATGLLRMTPADEMPKADNPWAAAESAMKNRPASVTAARRSARALLATNAVMGVAFVLVSAVSWHTSPTKEAPGWLLPVALTVFAIALLPVLWAWWRERAEKQAGGRG